MLVLIRRNLLVTAIVLALLAALLFRLGSILVPFLLGAAIAYFLDPVADRLQRRGMSRGLATALIALVVLNLALLAALLLLPTLVAQATQLVNSVPGAVRGAAAFLTERFPNLMEPGSFLNRTFIDLSERFRAAGLRILGGTLRSVLSLVQTLFVFIATPTVAIYLLYDWDRMIAAVNLRLPRRHAGLIRSLAADIDSVLSGFVRGQVIVALLLASFYSVTLMALGLRYALVIGILAGLLNFIPYLGSFAGFVLAVGVGLMQFWGEWWLIAAIGALFVFGQVVEGNVITPRIVGDSVKLHPVWLLAALAVFGGLFGFVGLLVAVPVAASLGVVIRWLDTRWLESDAYLGTAPPPAGGGAAVPREDRVTDGL